MRFPLGSPDVRVKPGDSISVWFSCGGASAVAAIKTVAIYGSIAKIRIMNNPVDEEDPDNIRFRLDVQDYLGVQIESVSSRHGTSAVEVWDKSKAMSFPHGAPCTTKLKKEARAEWESKNNSDWVVLGFTSDEVERSANFIKFERPNLLPVLGDLGMDKLDCFRFLHELGIKRPSIYDRGFPNANCVGCVKATSPTYWNLVRREYPEIFKQRAEQSRRLGVRLVRHEGERLFLDEQIGRAHV